MNLVGETMFGISSMNDAVQSVRDTASGEIRRRLRAIRRERRPDKRLREGYQSRSRASVGRQRISILTSSSLRRKPQSECLKSRVVVGFGADRYARKHHRQSFTMK